MENRSMANAQAQAGADFVDLGESYDANKIIEVLNDLVTDNRGMIDVYQTAADRLENKDNVELLKGYAEQHETFATELSNLVARYSGKPDTTATVGSVMTRAWVTLKAAVTEGDAPILSAVTQDAQDIMKSYGDVMSADLPDDARDMIRKHLSQLRLAHEKLSGLSEAYNN